MYVTERFMKVIYGFMRVMEGFMSVYEYVCMYARNYVCMCMCMHVRTYDDRGQLEDHGGTRSNSSARIAHT